MKNIIEHYRPDVNFWDIVPELTTIEPTRTLFIEDKSKKKWDSSVLMWTIAHLNDPDSIFYNIPNKYDLLARDHLKTPSFDWDGVRHLETAYVDCVLTQAKKSLVAWDSFMKKRDDFIKSQEYTFDYYQLDDDGANLLVRGKPVIVKGTADQLDKAASITAKLYADYMKIKKDLEEEQTKRGKGNKPKSLSDSNEI